MDGVHPMTGGRQTNGHLRALAFAPRSAVGDECLKVVSLQIEDSHRMCFGSELARKQLRFVRTWSVAIASVVAISASQPSSATTYPIQGKPGDRGFSERCPKGWYLSGFYGRAGAWMDRLGLICSPVLPAGELGTKRCKFGSHGGNGGSVFEIPCGKNEVISKIRPVMQTQAPSGGLKEIKQVNHIEMTCRNIKTKETNQRSAGSEDSGSPLKLQSCPSGEYAKGIQMRTGVHVNGIGLICGKFNIPAANTPQEDCPP